MRRVRTRASYAMLQAASGSYLSDDELRRIAPSIFAEEAHESRSSRYGFVPTIRIVEGMKREGLVPVWVGQSQPRDEGKRSHAKHMIRFRHRDALANTKHSSVHGGYHGITEAPEICALNSHDGSSRYKIFGGIVKFSCMNGLIIAHEFLGSIDVQHTQRMVEDAVEGSLEIIGKMEHATAAIEDMKRITLDRALQLEFAEEALKVRWDDPEKPAQLEPARLLIPNRYEDREQASTLWQTYNTAQEHLIRGGDKPGFVNGRRGRRTRAVTGIDQSVKINTKLWTLADDFRKRLA